MYCEKIALKKEYPVLGGDGRDPTLTLYLPYNMTEMGRQDQKRPCILICPGGGYYFCSQRESEPIALRFAAAGFNAFVLEYSVDTHRFPTQLREVAAAMELIHNHRDSWNCDTEHIAIMGFSAGGHLAAHYTNRFDCLEVREIFPESRPVQASILCYPVITAEPEYAHLGSFQTLTGCEELAQEQIEHFSCHSMVSAHTPPTFLWHTAQDDLVPVQNSLLYAGALAQQGIPFALHIYPYGGHGLATADAETCDDLPPEVQQVSGWIPEVKAWLERVLSE